MQKWDDHYLTWTEMEKLLPLRKEAEWLEANLCVGGALHIVLSDGNHERSSVQWCINYIESGEYAKHGIAAEEIALSDRQLAFAKALMQLTENQIEMVCSGTTVTEELFDHLYNNPFGIEPINVPAFQITEEAAQESFARYSEQA